MNINSISNNAGPWGSLKTLNQHNDNYVNFLKPDQKEILPKVNTLDPNGKILMGSYPGAGNKEEAMDKLDVLINELGVKTFLCLQESHELEELSNYLPLANRVAVSEGKEEPNFIHFPIRDIDIAKDDELLKFLKGDLIPQIEKGDILPLYIHCRGGNGRTGTVSALLLSHLYGLDGNTALEKVSDYHSTRKTPVFTAPETEEQEYQVLRLSESLTGIPSQLSIDPNSEEQEDEEELSHIDLDSELARLTKLLKELDIDFDSEDDLSEITETPTPEQIN